MLLFVYYVVNQHAINNNFTLLNHCIFIFYYYSLIMIPGCHNFNIKFYIRINVPIYI